MSEFQDVASAFWWYWTCGFLTSLVLHVCVLPGAALFRGFAAVLRADSEDR